MGRQTFDIIVVGAGVAGLVAAATAITAAESAAGAATGPRVALVHAGLGSFVYGGGCVADLHGVAADHPALALFRDITQAAQVPYAGQPDRDQMVPTILGTLSPVCLAPLSLWNGRVQPGMDVAVVGIDGLSAFDANFVAERLNRLSCGCRFLPRSIDLPRQDGLPHTALELANRFDRDPGFRQTLAERLVRVASDCEQVLIPAILGQWSGDEPYAQLQAAVGCPVAEMTTMPPSAVGLRLSNRLLSYLRGRDVELFGGYPLDKLDLADGRCQGLTIATPGHARTLVARSIVLATGPHSGHLLPGWDGSCDAAQRPLTSSGVPLAANLHIAGALADPAVQHGGNGRAILSGHAAALAALHREDDHATH